MLVVLLLYLVVNDIILLMDCLVVVVGDFSCLFVNYDISSVINGSVVGIVVDNGKVQLLLWCVMILLGILYCWGGSNLDSGFDCSGLVGYVFCLVLGIELLCVLCEMVYDDNVELINDCIVLVVGDLVFFGCKGCVDYVGIYVGDGCFLYVLSLGKDVCVDILFSGYWGNKFMQVCWVDF